MKLLNLKLSKYIIVGILTNLIDLVTYQALVFIGVQYIIADTLNLPLELGFNYLANKHYTFKSKASHKIELTKYLLNVLFIYCYATIFLVICVEVLEIKPEIAKFIQLASIPLFNFFILNRFIFREQKV